MSVHLSIFPSTCSVILLQLLCCQALAQQPGRSRVLANPISLAGGRVNQVNTGLGQGGGYFGDPRTGGRSHNGLDLTAEEGMPVQSVDSGTVIRSVSQQQPGQSLSGSTPLPLDTNSAGNRVSVRHQDGTTSSYYHLNGRMQPNIGERVEAGQIIGQVGRTGNVPARAETHLHFEYRDIRGVPLSPQIGGVATPSQVSNENVGTLTGNESDASTSPSDRPIASRVTEYTSPNDSVTPRQAGSLSATAGFRLRR